MRKGFVGLTRLRVGARCTDFVLEDCRLGGALASRQLGTAGAAALRANCSGLWGRVASPAGFRDRHRRAADAYVRRLSVKCATIVETIHTLVEMMGNKA